MLILFNKTSISILEKCHSASKDPKNGKKSKKGAGKLTLRKAVDAPAFTN